MSADLLLLLDGAERWVIDPSVFAGRLKLTRKFEAIALGLGYPGRAFLERSLTQISNVSSRGVRP